MPLVGPCLWVLALYEGACWTGEVDWHQCLHWSHHQKIVLKQFHQTQFWVLLMRCQRHNCQRPLMTVQLIRDGILHTSPYHKASCFLHQKNQETIPTHGLARTSDHHLEVECCTKQVVFSLIALLNPHLPVEQWDHLPSEPANQP